MYTIIINSIQFSSQARALLTQGQGLHAVGEELSDKISLLEVDGGHAGGEHDQFLPLDPKIHGTGDHQPAYEVDQPLA